MAKLSVIIKGNIGDSSRHSRTNIIIFIIIIIIIIVVVVVVVTPSCIAPYNVHLLATLGRPC